MSVEKEKLTRRRSRMRGCERVIKKSGMCMVKGEEWRGLVVRKGGLREGGREGEKSGSRWKR